MERSSEAHLQGNNTTALISLVPRWLDDDGIWRIRGSGDRMGVYGHFDGELRVWYEKSLRLWCMIDACFATRDAHTPFSLVVAFRCEDCYDKG